MVNTFPSELQSYVDDMIATGRFKDVHGLLQDAVALHRERELARREQHDQWKQAIAIGMDDLENGRMVDGETVFNQLLADLADEDVPEK